MLIMRQNWSVIVLLLTFGILFAGCDDDTNEGSQVEVDTGTDSSPVGTDSATTVGTDTVTTVGTDTATTVGTDTATTVVVDSATATESDTAEVDVLTDLGTIVYLDVSDENGAVPATYYQGHPVKITVRIDPAAGISEDDLLNDNMHVGLVTKLAEGQERSEGWTCYLGQLYDHRYGFTVTEGGQYEFISSHYIPEECLHSGKTDGVFNLWVALHPDRMEDDDDTSAGSSGDFNTQFFTTALEDLDGDRNLLCKTKDDVAGCVIDIPLSLSPGHNIVLSAADVASSVLVISPTECSETVGTVDHEFEVQTEVVVHGSDHFDGASQTHEYLNVLAAGDQVDLTFDLCPIGATGDCAYDYLSLSRAEAGAEVDQTVYADSFVYTELTTQRPYIAKHNLHLISDVSENGLCERLTGTAGVSEDWSVYQMFNLRTCISFPYEEASHSGTHVEDNCIIKQVRMVISDDTGNANASSLEFQKKWNQSVGNSVVGLSAKFGTDNQLNLSGAYSQTYAKANLTGWLNRSIIDLYFEARAWVSIVGSGVDSHIDILGKRYWEYSENIAEVSIARDYSYAKQYCVTYNYGIAGIGLNASMCASGEAGLNMGAEVTAVDGAGVAPFDESTRIGQAIGTVEPFTSFDMSASAYLNVALAKGGITGTIGLLDARIPAVANLNWGLIDGPQLVVAYDLSVPLKITTLNGNISVWVKLLKPKWCSRWWGGYPCGKWDTVVDKALVSYSGHSINYSLLAIPRTNETLF